MLPLLPEAAKLPDTLQAPFCRAWEKYTAAVADYQLPSIDCDKVLSSLVTVWASSSFVSDFCVRHPSVFHRWIAQKELLVTQTLESYREQLLSLIESATDVMQVATSLRQFRHEAMVKIAWRDIAGFADFEQTCLAISNVADVCIDVGVSWLYERLVKVEGHPLNPAGEPIRLAIIGLGKLGGRELNFSSDVDLLFAYECAGKTDISGLSHAEFFTRLAQQLIKLLHQRTPDGFVFRVDMRLRPYGESGALVLNFSGLQHYYHKEAREWERYPMIKARLVSGRPLACRALLKTLREFAYKPYLDYGIIQTLREMKRRINREVERKNLRDNIKIGAGGIREIEFAAQCFQLIRGGKDKRLREGNLLVALEQLKRAHLFSPEVATELSQAYLFLRTVENRLQMISDMQTHALPAPVLAQTQLIYGLGFESSGAFQEKLNAVRDFVHDIFLKQVTKPLYEFDTLSTQVEQYSLVKIWRAVHTNEETLFDTAQDVEAARLLKGLLDNKNQQNLSTESLARFEAVMPLLFAFIENVSDNILATLTRVLRVVEALLGRPYYFALLLENPKTIEHLVSLCQASPWITDLIANSPMLVDELRNSRALYAPLPPIELANELRQLLIALPSDDLEQQMDCLREFKQAQVLRVAAADTAGLLPLMKVSDHLTFTAIAILNAVLDIALRSLCLKQTPPLSYNTLAASHDLMVIAYGKLGGIELGYGSDLDLVFLYGEKESPDFLEAIKPMERAEFYLKLTKEMIYILNAPRPAGLLYKIDMRLRPSGDSGLLVNSLETFLQYQLESAWTWEHQALVRARVVCGNIAAEAQFQAIRQTILTQPRSLESLREDIASMRKKIQQANKVLKKDQFDLKLGRGGITDIEFIIQYCVLRFASVQTVLLTYPDNIRIAEDLGRVGILDQKTVQFLCETYRRYRAEVHRLDLQNQSSIVEMAPYESLCEQVGAIWQKFFGSPSLA